MLTKIIAHRGASFLAPENTMAAFELAYKLGADGIETDVHLTKDNIPVLIHDIHVKRTTNGSGYIKDLTWKQLKQLDAGSWFSNKFAGQPIISLEEFLRWIKQKKLCIHIELKNSKIPYKNLEFIVYEMVDHYQLLDRTTLSTFSVQSIRRMKQLNTNIEIALLTSKRRKNMVQHLQSIGANALHIKYHPFHSNIIKECLRMKVPIRVYTVNKHRHILRCFLQKYTGIITDMPDRCKRYRSYFQKK